MDGARWLGVNDRTRAIGLLLALVLLALLALVFALAPVWRLYALLPADRLSSDRLRVTHELATRWSDGVPDVLFIGGSQVREALPDTGFVETELSRACGRPVRVFNATSSAQPPESSWAVLESLGPRTPALVVSGLSPWRATDGRGNATRLARALLPLGRPNHLNGGYGELPLGAAARMQNQLGILFADASQAMRFPAASVEDPFQGAHNQYVTPTWPEDRKRIELEYTLLVGGQTGDATLRANLDFYRRMAAFARERGGAALFLLPPAMSGGPRFAAMDARVELQLESLAREAAVLDLRQASGLGSADFYDTVHLVAEGRRKLWPRLRAELLSRLPDCADPMR